jgi:hypothetical protein
MSLSLITFSLCKKWTPEEREKFMNKIKAKYESEGHPYFSSAR